MTLTKFLLARIAEDESEARTAGVSGVAGGNSLVAFDVDDVRALVVDPARVLAECEAKRRLIEWGTTYWAPEANQYAHMLLEEFAAIYADHPDYDEAWRP